MHLVELTVSVATESDGGLVLCHQLPLATGRRLAGVFVRLTLSDGSNQQQPYPYSMEDPAMLPW